MISKEHTIYFKNILLYKHIYCNDKMNTVIDTTPSVTTLKAFWEARKKGFKPVYIIICRDCKEFRDVGPFLIEGNKVDRKYCEDCI